MPQIEEMARVPTKMMEDFIPLRKKCASYSCFTYFVLTLVLGMFIGKLLSSPQQIQVSIYDVLTETYHFCTTIVKLNTR